VAMVCKNSIRHHAAGPEGQLTSGEAIRESQRMGAVAPCQRLEKVQSSIHDFFAGLKLNHRRLVGSEDHINGAGPNAGAIRILPVVPRAERCGGRRDRWGIILEAFEDRRKMKLRVECYAGGKADERPVRFQVGEQARIVEERLDQWYGPNDSFFKVRADDGNL
jgi:hypothetical protein